MKFRMQYWESCGTIKVRIIKDKLIYLVPAKKSIGKYKNEYPSMRQMEKLRTRPKQILAFGLEVVNEENVTVAIAQKNSYNCP